MPTVVWEMFSPVEVEKHASVEGGYELGRYDKMAAHT